MKRFWMVGLLVLLVGVAWAGEQVDLFVPDQASTGTPHYWIGAILMDREAGTVIIRLGSDSGLRKTITIWGADAMTYIRAANKRDSSSVSLEKWTLTQLINKGYIVGSITGSPD
jgi:hypothetical protein